MKTEKQTTAIAPREAGETNRERHNRKRNERERKYLAQISARIDAHNDRYRREIAQADAQTPAQDERFTIATELERKAQAQPLIVRLQEQDRLAHNAVITERDDLRTRLALVVAAIRKAMGQQHPDWNTLRAAIARAEEKL